MKTPEDEAFDELSRRQGAWGGGFQAKRQAAMDKVNAEFYEEYIKYRTAFPKGYIAPPKTVQEPLHIVQSNGKHSPLLTHMMNKQTTPPKRPWVGLTDEDIERIKLMTYEKETNADGEEQEAVNIDWLIKTAEHFCKEKNT